MKRDSFKSIVQYFGLVIILHIILKKYLQHSGSIKVPGMGVENDVSSTTVEVGSQLNSNLASNKNLDNDDEDDYDYDYDDDSDEEETDTGYTSDEPETDTDLEYTTDDDQEGYETSELSKPQNASNNNLKNELSAFVRQAEEKQSVKGLQYYSGYKQSDFGNESLDLNSQVKLPKTQGENTFDLQVPTSKKADIKAVDEVTTSSVMYKDESVMNGGEFSNGILGYDKNDFGYASLL